MSEKQFGVTAPFNSQESPRNAPKGLGENERRPQLDYPASEMDILPCLKLHEKILKSTSRAKFTATLSHLGSRFLSSSTDSDDIRQKDQMARFLMARPALKDKIAEVMDPNAFASTMDRCNFQSNVSAHVITDEQLRQDLAALVADGVVDLFEGELPDECEIVRRHEDFLAILST